MGMTANGSQLCVYIVAVLDISSCELRLVRLCTDPVRSIIRRTASDTCAKSLQAAGQKVGGVRISQ